MTGRIVFAATPLGNVRDASARLWEAFAIADVVACEDTRTTKELLARAGVSAKGEFVASHDHNEAQAAPRLVGRAQQGAYVLVVSDAGMPLISDPGFKVLEAALAADVPVEILPGPSAALTALAISGLPTDRFTFEGFPPRKDAEKASVFEALAGEARTMIFFEAPHRIDATLATMATVFGADRRASVSRELTKKFEETKRGTLAELAAWAGEAKPKGEMVVVVAGRQADAPSLATLVAEALSRVEGGERAKDAVAHLSATFGVPQRELYAAVLAARQ